MPVTHAYTSTKADPADVTLIGKTKWNAGHTGTELDCWNVKDPTYGATGNGSTDDTTAINAAITAAYTAGGGEVLIPLGTYLVSGITLKNNVVLRGAGYLSVLKLKNSMNTGVVTAQTYASRVGMVNLRLDGNKANQTENNECYGFVSTTGGVNDSFVRDCWIDNTLRSSIYMEGARNEAIGNRITGCGNTTDPGRTAIVFSGENVSIDGGYGRIIGNYIYGAYEYGIKLYQDSPNTTISDNVIDSSHRYGIYVNRCDHVTISGNSLIRTVQAGILVQAESGLGLVGVTVSGNAVADSGSHGINVWGSGSLAQNVTVVGNTVHGCAGNGIYVLAAPGAVVSGNTCIANTSDGGIVFNASPNGAITGNVCRNNGAAGAGAGILAWDGGTGSTHVVCTGNRCYDDASGYQHHGIRTLNASNYWTVIANDCQGNATAGISLVGANNLSDHNIVA
jgi:parallel beta-helix repeat protein